MKTETETGVMQPQAKEHPAPPEAGRGRKGPLEPPEEADTLISDFWPPYL